MLRILRNSVFGLVFLSTLFSAAPPASAAYPDRPVHWIIGFCRRRPGRHRGADHGELAVGPPRPAIHRREPRRLRRQHRGRRRDQLSRPTATRCCSSRPTTRSRPRSTRSCRSTFCATPCRSPASCSSPTCWSSPTRFRRRRFRSSSTTARPIPARSPLPRPATAPRCTCRRSCSR